MKFTTQLIWTSTQYNIINNNTKFKDQLEVEFATTSIYVCVYIYKYFDVYFKNDYTERSLLMEFQPKYSSNE
jgi:hypothetical protein